MNFTSNQLNNSIDNSEFLYRGVIEINWDFNNSRPSSATFKDSKGVSVDRDAQRLQADCVTFLKSKREFFAICKVNTGIVRGKNTIVKYLPEKRIFIIQKFTIQMIEYK